MQGLQDGGKCVRAPGKLGEAVLHEAESDDEPQRKGSPKSEPESVRTQKIT
jgi:hypothetical protein